MPKHRRNVRIEEVDNGFTIESYDHDTLKATKRVAKNSDEALAQAQRMLLRKRGKKLLPHAEMAMD